MTRRGGFVGGQDNLSVPDAPTIGAATAGNTEVSVAFTAPLLLVMILLPNMQPE